MPLKDYHILLAGNYTNCEKRMKNLTKKLSKNEKLLQDYNDILKEQLAHNITEKISEDDSEKINDIGTVHYLTHRLAIKQERETTKVRIVFGASSKITGPPLNVFLQDRPLLNLYFEFYYVFVLIV